MIVSRETELLSAYVQLVRKWNSAINLIARSTIDDIDERHIRDSLQVAEVAAGRGGDWIDLGSGGGFPGIVVAIHRPAMSVTLIESDKRKSSFLRNTARELCLGNVKVVSERIESLTPMNAMNVSARALAALPLLLSYCHRHLNRNGVAWLLKGKTWQSEIDAAMMQWSFDYTAHQSSVNSDSVILEIKELKHA